jgi:MoxR-like ATPase
MSMTVEDLKKAVQDGDIAVIDRPEMTALIETLPYDLVESLHDDDVFVERVMAPIHRLHDELVTSFVERDELIRIALASFLVQVPMIVLGPPGTAKSLVLRELASRLGLRERPSSIAEIGQEMLELSSNGQGATPPQRRFFEYLVTRYTTADEILGPPDLNLMIKHALFYRQTAGLLPEAQVAFLDEIFKANSAILNALLSIMNERLFYNAGRATSIPLCMVFGASNEPPPDQDLSALYDRFPIRVMCNPVTDEKDTLRRALLAANTHLLHDVLGGPKRKKKPQIASVNHFRLMFRLLLVREVTWQGPEATEFWNSFVDTFRVFRREFQISDRSLARFYRLAQGLALLRKKKYPQRSEIEVFKYSFRDMESAAALADAVDDRVHRR